MPGPKPPTPENLIAYTKATGELYFTVHDDEHYYKLTGQRVPWYKPPVEKPPTNTQINADQAAKVKIAERKNPPAPSPGQQVTHIEDTRKLEKLTTPPTPRELKRTEIKTQTDDLKLQNDLEAELAKAEAAKAKGERDYRGEPVTDAIVRINNDISNNLKLIETLDSYIPEPNLEKQPKGEYVKDIFTPDRNPFTGDLTDIAVNKKLRKGRNETELARVDLETRKIEAQKRLFEVENAKKSDSLNVITNAAMLNPDNIDLGKIKGFSGVGETYTKRKAAIEYVNLYVPIHLNLAMQALERDLGFKPSPEFLKTPKGQQIFLAAQQSVRDETDAQLKNYGFNFKEAFNLLKLTGKKAGEEISPENELAKYLDDQEKAAMMNLGNDQPGFTPVRKGSL